MRFEQLEDKFVFSKDENLRKELIDVLPNGMIKEYPDFFLLEQVPQYVKKEDFDVLVVDGKEVKWEDIVYFTKDRIKATTSDVKKEAVYEIMSFYVKRYDAEKVRRFFEKKGFENSLFFHDAINELMDMEFYNLPADTID